MDAPHERVVKAFPATDGGQGNQVARAARERRAVKVYELPTEELQWVVAPGQSVKAWALQWSGAGTPQIRV
jgi:hypothetical protein